MIHILIYLIGFFISYIIGYIVRKYDIVDWYFKKKTKPKNDWSLQLVFHCYNLTNYNECYCWHN
jgi:hypothetical protein